MDPELIAEKARKSIGTYCFDECKSYCCRKGFLVLNAKEAELVTRGKVKELEDKGVLKRLETSGYSLNLAALGHCPCLVDFKCSIHKDPGRPLACRQFPIFVFGNKVRISERCMAMKDGKLYEFISQFIDSGYEVCDNVPFSELDFASLDIKNVGARKFLRKI